MRYPKHAREAGARQANRAAVFVDYENLYALVAARAGEGDHPDEYITELLDELRHHLKRERTSTALIFAYADFSSLDDDGAPYIQRSLYLQGAEPRYVPGTLQRNATEIQLCVDAMEVLHSRSDVRTFVILTGDRAYLPLVQQLKRYGCRVLVASFENPVPDNQARYVDGDFFLDAMNLLSDASRRTLLTRNGHVRDERTPRAPRENVTYETVEDDAALRTLEIIDEHFGQYDEVYLTPLLRKLSEILVGDEYDPKTIISDLETAGAVYLEKRRGYPYDYTVLIVDENHPDVARIQEASPYRDEDDYEEEEEFTDDEEFADDYDEEYDGNEATYEDSDWDEPA